MREARWFLGNMALFLVLAFGLLVVAALALAIASRGDAIGLDPNGPVFPQVLSWALASMLFAVVWLAPVALLIVLAVYRGTTRAVGHPRAMAYLVAGATASLILLVPRAEPTWFAIAGAVALSYAAILRMPGQGLDTLPTPIRASVIGLSLSLYWLVGSVAAIWIAVDEHRHGRQGTAGWILVAGTVLPAILLFADLWRDDVPALNYVITVAFGAVALLGLAILGGSMASSRGGQG